MKKRHQLPAFLCLKKKFDHQRILQEFKQLNLDNWNLYDDLLPGGSMYENGCQYRGEFLKNFLSDEEISRQGGTTCLHGGENYRQLALTQFNEAVLSLPGTPPQRPAVDGIECEGQASARERVQRVREGSGRYFPQADERNFTKRASWVQGVFSEILDSFAAPLARCRLALMQPGFRVREHIDFNTDYAIRLHIPIVTNQSARIGVRYKGEVIERHLPADGSIWFINAGYPHYAYNDGAEPRVHLVLTLSGQQDLQL